MLDEQDLDEMDVKWLYPYVDDALQIVVSIAFVVLFFIWCTHGVCH